MSLALRPVVLAALLVGFALAVCAPVRAGEPVVDHAAIEKQVRADLDAAYAAFTAKERDWQPNYRADVGRLCSPDRDQRAEAGAYLGILVRMTDADARAGRTPRRGGWTIGGPQDVGDEIRSDLARALARAPLDPAAVEALEAALWLANEDRLDADRVAGAMAVAQVRHPEADAALVGWVTAPHSTGGVVVVALEAVAKRKLVAAAPGVRALCAHWRESIAKAARAAAEALGLKDPPSFDDKRPLPADVLRRLEELAATVAEPIPAGATWAKVRFASPRRFDFDGRARLEATCWIVERSETSLRLLDTLGHAFRVAAKDVTVVTESLAESARALIAMRRAAFEPPDEARSSAFVDHVGMVTFVGHQGPWTGSLPEVLLAAWCARAGEADTARDLLLPLLRAHEDEGALFELAFEQLASRVDRDMLDAFTGRRYEEALRLARHAAGPRFDRFWAQDRAKELVEEIPRRGEDGRSLTLPSKTAWAELRARLARDAQVEFLAARLRLIHDVQGNIPGGIDWAAPQYDVPDGELPAWRAPDRETSLARHLVINPYVELSRMNLEARELVPLVRRLDSPEHLLAYDLPRFMPHFPRTLHRARWLAATLIEAVLGDDTVSREIVEGTDGAARAKHLEELSARCRAAGARTEADRRAEELTSGTEDGELQQAYGRLGALDAARAVSVVLERAEREPAQRGRWIRLAYAVDGPVADGAAEAFLGDGDEAAAFWAAALMLRQGQGEVRRRGLEAVLAALERGDPHARIDVVLDDLLRARDARVDALLGRYLASPRDLAHRPTVLVLQRAFLLGRQEAFDGLVDRLEGKGGMPLISYDGDGEVDDWRRGDVESADELAGHVRFWLAPSMEHALPGKGDGDRKAKLRAQAVVWLEEAFDVVRAGATPEVRPERRPLPLGRWAWVSSGWVLQTR